MMRALPQQFLQLLFVATTLSGCALFQDYGAKTDAMHEAEAKVPTQWQAPIPHDGKVENLKDWWAQFDDPLLLELISAAQTVSPTLATARTHIAQAHATAVTTGSALLPSLNATASRTRGQQDIRFPAGTMQSSGFTTQWEIDLFGANYAASNAADIRVLGARADWHAARVSVAAEVANDYITLRACEAQLDQNTIDAASRSETARLTDINAQVGFESPANAAMARASAAQANSALVQQRAQCDIQTKVMVELTAIDETILRQKLAAGKRGTVPQPAAINVTEVPAAVLSQRPDLYSAAQAVMAANADVFQLKAQRFPQISLTGNVGHSSFESPLSRTSGRVWSLGPITLTLPIFDGGTISANIGAGRARYEEAATQYAGKLRTAVREVEESLINLQSTAERQANAQTAVDGYTYSFRAVETRQKNGMANLFELEDARRSMVTAQNALINLQRERVSAWISLYRALGGGWNMAEAKVAENETQQIAKQTTNKSAN